MSDAVLELEQLSLVLPKVNQITRIKRSRQVIVHKIEEKLCGHKTKYSYHMPKCPCDTCYPKRSAPLNRNLSSTHFTNSRTKLSRSNSHSVLEKSYCTDSLYLTEVFAKQSPGSHGAPTTWETERYVTIPTSRQPPHYIPSHRTPPLLCALGSRRPTSRPPPAPRIRTPIHDTGPHRREHLCGTCG